MDISRVGGRIELSVSSDQVRRIGMFSIGLGVIALAGGGGAMAVGQVRIIALIATIIAIVALPIGVYLTIFASRISDQRHVEFDRDRQTVVGGKGARTVTFRAIDHLTVTRTGQYHALELVLRNGTTWRLHTESTQNPKGCDGIANAASQIAEATGLPLR